jgi:CubicO group peptidase (beta-lactamase class C family)
MSVVERTGSKLCFVVALAVLLAPRQGTAQDVVHEERARKVDSLFAEWDERDSPGCALGILRNGELVYTKGYGMADLERGLTMTPKTVFYLASVSKQFTAASVALLSLEGKMSLDDDVRRYVPELPDYGERITLRHLIHHTSGLRDYLTLMELAGLSLDEAHTPEEILRLVARQKNLNFAPGERYLYSNTGYFLMPIIVQRVTGKSIREFASKRIFGLLGMGDTHFHDDYTHEVAGRAMSYRRNDDGEVEPAFLAKFDQVGSGGVLSNVEDLARWDSNFYEPRVGGPEFLELQHQRGILNDGDTLSYALGLTVGIYKGLRTVSHGGSMMGFRTYLLRFPEQRFSAIVLCNLEQINPGRLAFGVADIHLEQAFGERLAEYTGSYYADELGVTWTLSVEDGNLMLQGVGDSTVTLQSAGLDRFRSPRGGEIEFSRGASGVVTGFSLDAGRAQGIVFDRR